MSLSLAEAIPAPDADAVRRLLALLQSSDDREVAA